MKKRGISMLLALASVGCFVLASCGGGNSGAGSSVDGGAQNSQPSQGTQLPKTDEEKIRATVNKFVKEYNDGDFEGVLECMEPKMRNTMRALFNTLGGIAGGKLGVDINLADLFSLGVGMEDGDFINFDIQDVAIGDGKASVTAHMNLAPATSETMYIILVEEDGEWLIENITDKKSSIGSGESIIIKRVEVIGFTDGYVNVGYEKNGKGYCGLINTNGEMIYSKEGSTFSTAWNHLGNGMGWINEKNEETGVYDKYIVNSKFEVVATSVGLDFDNIIGEANGCAWVYKYKSGINGAQYLYNCVDTNGNLKGEWVDLQILYNSSSYDDPLTVVSEDIALIDSEAGYMAVLNIVENSVLWLRDTEVHGIYNGKIYGKGGTYHTSRESAVKRENGTELSRYYCINPDGSIEDVFDENLEDVFEYGVFTDGKLIHGHDRWTLPEAEGVYIYDLETKNLARYTDYSREMVQDIRFYGDYGVVDIRGLDYNSYFTVIDKNGNQQFEPIMCNQYRAVSYSEGMLAYCTKYDGWDSNNIRYSIVDLQGNVIVPESAGYCAFTKFSNGLAFARRGETEEWVMIDKQGNVVIENFTVQE